MHSPASVRHEEQVAFLTILLGTFIATRNLGRIMSSNTVMQLGQRRFCPDLSFLATSHADRIQGERIVGPMDLVVEMVSRSTREYDLGEKRRLYREGLIPEIWFIDPEHRQWEVDLLEHGVYTTEVLSQGRWISHVLAGLSVDVTSIWSDPLPSPIACLKQAKLLD